MANTSISDFRAAFAEDCIGAGALKFGTFKLKSGRVSPYFFNSGLFYRANLLRSISTAFAHTLAEAKTADGSSLLEFDILFGPAFKGIPLAVATLEKLATLDGKRFGSACYTFDRRPPKDYGEGGDIVGAPMKGKRVVIIDDVITAGTAIRQSTELVEKHGGILVAIVVGFDRQESVTSGGASAISAVQKEYGVPVMSILTLNHLIQHLESTAKGDDVQRLQDYRKEYGAQA